MKPVIAVDGPAASGKGTLARRLAEILNLPYLDTGLLYRAVGRRMLDNGADLRDAALAEAAAKALVPEDLARGNLRVPETDMAASTVAAVPGVRAALLDFQRNFAADLGGVVDGRDIGTVVFPDATVKLFVTATPEERANRRCNELKNNGIAADYARVLTDIRARDMQDATRAIAPLRPAKDAILLDTTLMNANEALETALEIVRERLAKAAG